MTIWEIQHSLEILLFKVSEIEQLLISNVYLFNSFLPQFKAIKFWLQKIFIYLLKSQVVWQTVERCKLFVTKWNWVNFIDVIAISKLMYSNSKTCVSKTAKCYWLIFSSLLWHKLLSFSSFLFTMSMRRKIKSI